VSVLVGLAAIALSVWLRPGTPHPHAAPSW